MVMNKIHWMKLSPAIAFVIFLPIALVLLVLNSQGDGRASYWTTFPLIYLILWWFQSDRSDRAIQLPLDTGFLIAVLWPVVMPIYLFKTLGLKAFRAFFVFLVIVILSCLFAFGVFIIRYIMILLT